MLDVFLYLCSTSAGTGSSDTSAITVSSVVAKEAGTVAAISVSFSTNFIVASFISHIFGLGSVAVGNIKYTQS